MGERKVLNKYIPADFDPALVPRGKKLSSKDGTVPVRMMLPFSVQCSTCKTFLYRGRKFNSKKEPMGGPQGRYLNIQRFRFYIKCTHCSRPITFLTDPKNADYEMESGGTRNYEVYKDKELSEGNAMQEKEQQEKEDPMKALENRVLDSQREMADLDNLEEIKAMNLRHIHLLSGVSETGAKNIDGNGQHAAKAVLDAIHQADDEAELVKNNNDVTLTEEDEALIKSIQFGQKKRDYSTNDNDIIRLTEEDEHRLDEKRRKEAKLFEDKLLKEEYQKTATFNVSAAVASKKKLPVIIKKRTKQPEQQQEKKKVKATTNAATDNNNSQTLSTSTPKNGGEGLSDLLGGYSSSSNSDSD